MGTGISGHDCRWSGRLLGMGEKLSDVLQRTCTYVIHDHEVLLVFNSDDDSAAFQCWLGDIGWSIFQHHLKGDQG